MKLKKIHKFIKQKLKLDYWMLFLIPITAFIWIVAQIWILSQYNAVALFSWWQVFSDSAIILPLILSLITWYISYLIFLKLKPNKLDNTLAIFYLFVFGLVSIIILSLISVKNIYLLGLFIFFFFWYISSIINSIDVGQKSNKEIWKYIIPWWIYIFFFMLFVVIFWMWWVMLWFINQGLEIQIDWTEYDIQYMNDKYIIYWEWEVLKIEGSNYKIKLLP
jgi:hypothetical protein